jgi:hypothetical protein
MLQMTLTATSLSSTSLDEFICRQCRLSGAVPNQSSMPGLKKLDLSGKP